jgi:hypothetical protein
MGSGRRRRFPTRARACQRCPGDVLPPARPTSPTVCRRFLFTRGSRASPKHTFGLYFRAASSTQHLSSESQVRSHCSRPKIFDFHFWASNGILFFLLVSLFCFFWAVLREVRGGESWCSIRAAWPAWRLEFGENDVDVGKVMWMLRLDDVHECMMWNHGVCPQFL